jgi:hypothetical protein
MFKRILLVSLLTLVFSNSYAGLKCPEYEKVFECQGTTSQLYDTAKVYLAQNVQGIKFDLEDKAANYFIASGNIKSPASGLMVMMESGWKLYFTVRIDFKENKFKLLFTNIRVMIPANQNTFGGSMIDNELGNYSDSRIKDIQEALTKLGDGIVASAKEAPKKADW